MNTTESNKTSEENNIFDIYKDSKKFVFYIYIENIDNEDNIIIKCYEETNKFKAYEISMNLKDFIQKENTFRIFENIKEIYLKLILLFKNNKVNIESIQDNVIIISFSIYDPFEGLKNIELSLAEKENNQETFIKDIFKQIEQLKEEVSKLKQENLLLKNDLNNEKEQNKLMKEELMKEINKIKDENRDLLKKFNSLRISINLSSSSGYISQGSGTSLGPPPFVGFNENGKTSELINILKIKELNTSTIYKQKDREIVFSVFKTLDDKYYLAYRRNNSIVLNNLIDGKEKEITTPHENAISFIKHYIDTRFNKEKDIIISCSNSDNKCKIWDLNNLNCMYVINIKFYYEIESIALKFKYDNIFLYACSNFIKEPIKYYDIYGLEKILKNSHGETNFIETFKDIKNDKNYLISCNNSCVLAFDIDKNELYKSFKDFNKDVKHLSAILYFDEENNTKLIEGNEKGEINIWSFLSGILHGKIILKDPINEMLLWNQNYLFVYDSCNINVISIKESKIIKKMEISKYKSELFSLQKIELPDLGECLITQNKKNELIILWQIKISKK